MIGTSRDKVINSLDVCLNDYRCGNHDLSRDSKIGIFPRYENSQHSGNC